MEKAKPPWWGLADRKTAMSLVVTKAVLYLLLAIVELLEWLGTDWPPAGSI